MRSLYACFVFIVGLAASSCSPQYHVYKPAHKPTKQCKIAGKNRLADNKKKKKKVRRAIEEEAVAFNLTASQAQDLADQEFLRNLERVKKSVSEIDVMNDCPPELKRSVKSKKKKKNQKRKR